MKKAAQLAYTIVSKLGMSEKIGLIGYEVNEYGQKKHSDQTSREIDMEVRRIIGECTERTRQILNEHKAETEK